jgi:hypothetical protein
MVTIADYPLLPSYQPLTVQEKNISINKYTEIKRLLLKGEKPIGFT